MRNSKYGNGMASQGSEHDEPAGMTGPMQKKSVSVPRRPAMDIKNKNKDDSSNYELKF